MHPPPPPHTYSHTRSHPPTHAPPWCWGNGSGKGHHWGTSAALALTWSHSHFRSTVSPLLGPSREGGRRRDKKGEGRRKGKRKVGTVKGQEKREMDKKSDGKRKRGNHQVDEDNGKHSLINANNIATAYVDAWATWIVLEQVDCRTKYSYRNFVFNIHKFTLNGHSSQLNVIFLSAKKKCQHIYVREVMWLLMYCKVDIAGTDGWTEFGDKVSRFDCAYMIVCMTIL